MKGLFDPTDTEFESFETSEVAEFCIYKKAKQEAKKYNLVNYGIHKEKSDMRAHVTKNHVFIFNTKDAIQSIVTHHNNLNLKPTGQNGYNKYTAVGYCAPWGKRKTRYETYPPSIFPLKRKGTTIFWDKDHQNHVKKWQEKYPFKDTWNTSTKGKWAMACVKYLMRNGWFPLPVEEEKEITIEEDISGIDILIYCNKRIQVKCDWPAYQTGNLYLQIAESNPFKHK